MQIGDVAKHFDLNPKTIRYYEGIGLLPEPVRTESGYRQYDDEAVSRLGFIQRAKLLGLSLENIRDILAVHEHGEQPCEQVLSLIDAEIAGIEMRIRELKAFRTDLTALRVRWSDEATRHGEEACLCPIIEEQSEVADHPALDLPLAPAKRRGRATAAR